MNNELETTVQSDQLAAGRAIVLAVIVAFIGLHVTWSVCRYTFIEFEMMPHEYVWHILTFWGCASLFQGIDWVRWIAAFLAFIAGGTNLLLGCLMLIMSPSNWVALYFAVGIVYIACATALLFIPSVRSYFGR